MEGFKIGIEFDRVGKRAVDFIKVVKNHVSPKYEFIKFFGDKCVFVTSGCVQRLDGAAVRVVEHEKTLEVRGFGNAGDFGGKTSESGETGHEHCLVPHPLLDILFQKHRRPLVGEDEGVIGEVPDV